MFQRMRGCFSKRSLVRSARQASGRERGTAIVEFALILPVFVLIAGGVVDYGIAYRAKQTVQSASRNAARVGAAATDDGNRRYSDLLMLRSVYESLSGDSGTRNLLNENITSDTANKLQMLVYEPDSATGMPRVGCLSGIGLIATSNCNRYNVDDIKAAAKIFSATSGGKLDDSAKALYNSSTYLSLRDKAGLTTSCSTCWSPLARNSGQADASGTELYSQIGVYVSAQRRTFFASIVPAGPKTLPSRTVFRAEKGSVSANFTNPEGGSGTNPPRTTQPPPTVPKVNAPSGYAFCDSDGIIGHYVIGVFIHDSKENQTYVVTMSTGETAVATWDPTYWNGDGGYEAYLRVTGAEASPGIFYVTGGNYATPVYWYTQNALPYCGVATSSTAPQWQPTIPPTTGSSPTTKFKPPEGGGGNS